MTGKGVAAGTMRDDYGDLRPFTCTGSDKTVMGLVTETVAGNLEGETEAEEEAWTAILNTRSIAVEHNRPGRWEHPQARSMPC